MQNMYFNKEEERLLRGLLAKMKTQADKVRGSWLCVPGTDLIACCFSDA